MYNTKDMNDIERSSPKIDEIKDPQKHIAKIEDIGSSTSSELEESTSDESDEVVPNRKPIPKPRTTELPVETNDATGEPIANNVKKVHANAIGKEVQDEISADVENENLSEKKDGKESSSAKTTKGNAITKETKRLASALKRRVLETDVDTLEVPIMNNNINNRDARHNSGNSRDARPKSGRGMRRKNEEDIEAGKRHKDRNPGKIPLLHSRHIIHSANSINNRDARNNSGNSKDARPKSGRGMRRKNEEDIEAGKRHKDRNPGADVRDIRELLTQVKDDVVTGPTNQQDSGIYTIPTGPDVYKPSLRDPMPHPLEHKTFIQHRTGFIETPSSEKNILEFDEKTLCDERERTVRGFSLAMNSPLDIAIGMQAGFHHVTNVCHGLLGGVSLFQLILVWFIESTDPMPRPHISLPPSHLHIFTRSDNPSWLDDMQGPLSAPLYPTRHLSIYSYASLAFLPPALGVFLLVICLVSVLDR
ncbi:hypothetical protein WDU94_000207 [Cyamophila willieti]